MRLLIAFQGNQVRLVAPSLWQYEIANALKIAVVRRRLNEEEGREALGSLFDLGVSLVDFRHIAVRAWQLAIERGVTVYDASYLALAEQRQCPCYSADRRLVRACADTGLVFWIGDFT